MGIPISDRLGFSECKVPEQPVAGKMALSKEGLGIVARGINQAAAQTLAAALEMSGDISGIAASKAGVGVFLEKRKPVFRVSREGARRRGCAQKESAF
jgi:hypothetical protein